VTVPGATSINQDVPVIFSAANSNAISVTDLNAGTNADRLTLTAANGTIKLATTTGLHIIAGKNKSSYMTISGNLAHLNPALNGLTFTPAAGYLGDASLAFSLQNVGNGLSGVGSVGLTVSAVTGSVAGDTSETGSAHSNSDWAGFSAAVDE